MLKDEAVMSISELSIAELKDLLSRIPKEIERRQKEERQQAIKELEAIAAQRGFDLNDLLSEAPVKQKQTRAAVAAKYQNPSNPEQTWTGRGRQPKWVVEFLANGGTMEQIQI